MELASLIADGRVAIIGPIRQEILSGIKERAHFDRLRDHLRAFSDTEITSDDYEGAASFYNSCRAKGMQGSNTDFLICAIAVRNEFSIFTADGDFTNFAKVLPIELYDVGKKTTQSTRHQPEQKAENIGNRQPPSSRHTWSRQERHALHQQMTERLEPLSHVPEQEPGESQTEGQRPEQANRERQR